MSSGAGRAEDAGGAQGDGGSTGTMQGLAERAVLAPEEIRVMEMWWIGASWRAPS